MLAEKKYDVVAEMEDGGTKVLAVRAESPSQAFGIARAMPGVRRVGRVSEPGQHAGHARHDRTAQDNGAPERFAPSGAGSIAIPLAGPRVVLPAPRGGGEQPFRFLEAPPERPKPAPAPAPVAAKPAKPSPAAVPSADAPSISADPEYRIVKSRRRDGQPFLLQRGRWQAANGKRTFQVEWEQGFDTREAAEGHRDSVTPQPAELPRSA
jgi:hypothetical protein